MGVSYYVQGYKPVDEKYKKMKEVWDSCDELGIAQPAEVTDFFNEERPPKGGVGLMVDIDAKEGGSDYENWYEVDVASLDEDIKTLRFIISC